MKNEKVKNKDNTTAQPKSKQRSEEYLEYQRYIRSKEFKIVREKVLERDGYRCQCCSRNLEEDGKDICLSVHHSKYDGVLYHELEGDNLKYLITMCKICHKGIHSSPSNFKRFSMKKKIVEIK